LKMHPGVAAEQCVIIIDASTTLSPLRMSNRLFGPLRRITRRNDRHLLHLLSLTSPHTIQPLAHPLWRNVLLPSTMPQPLPLRHLHPREALLSRADLLIEQGELGLEVRQRRLAAVSAEPTSRFAALHSYPTLCMPRAHSPLLHIPLQLLDLPIRPAILPCPV
jgi:hypothetical protein